jgi:RNA polymerase sigma-70 factor (ECF subfamily)
MATQSCKEKTMPEESTQVTALLTRLKRGDREAAELLIPLVMDELRRLARYYMLDERAGHTLQPTALVHEAYLKMAGYQNLSWKSRSHFIGVAAGLMRQILIDSARRHRAVKRGRLYEQVSLEEHRDFISVEYPVDLLALDEALQRLEKMNPRQSRIVELRYFGGLSVEETAEVLGVSPITVKRDWATARAWLRSELKATDQSGR